MNDQQKVLGVLLKWGRTSPLKSAEECSTGDHGPILKLEWFNSVFLEDQNFVFTEDYKNGTEAYRYTEDMSVAECIYYDGVWYSDFEVSTWNEDWTELFDVNKSLYKDENARKIAQEARILEQTEPINAQTFTIHWQPKIKV